MIVCLIVLSVAAPTAGQEPSLPLAQLFDGTRVLVLPFRNISGDPSTDWVGTGIAEAVAADLPPTAEVVLLDPDLVSDRATPDDPQAVSSGIEKVWVNGELAWDNGEITGARPGKALRRRVSQ